MTESIHPATGIGAVHLTVRDLGRQIAFYREQVGLEGTEGTEGTGDRRVALGPPGGPALLVLHEHSGAPVVRGATGLYHFAILVPDRPALAAVLRHFGRARTPLQGASDHGVSEAIYLADPEGNGIEIYRDRPRAEWPMENGKLAMGTSALDVASLLAEPDLGGAFALPAGTRMGHVHLKVQDIGAAEAFYHNALGFDLVMRYGPSASFVSAGGYHHHIGFNTWESRGASPPPEGAAGLDYFEVKLPDTASREAVLARARAAGIEGREQSGGVLFRDPSGNGVLLTAG